MIVSRKYFSFLVNHKLKSGIFHLQPNYSNRNIDILLEIIQTHISVHCKISSQVFQGNFSC